jgi:RND superfamily putative drug exporter
MGDAFGEGEIIPTYVMLNMSEKVASVGSFNIKEMNTIENATSAIAIMSDVQQVISPTRPNGGSEPINFVNLSSYSIDIASQYTARIRSMIGEDGRAVRITVVFVDGPYTPQSIGTLKEIRSALASIETDPTITAIYITGATALVYDIVSSTQSDFQIIVVVAIVLIYVVLMVVLGSVINPLRSLVILISICWTLAALVLVFQIALNIPILWSIPIILLVICLGLGMDYDILLTTRIREEASKGQSDNEAIAHSIEQTGGIITTCGIIMASAFATMMLSTNTMLIELGFALSFAILVDATVVRMYMVPAIMSLLGKWNWYAPGRLQRVKREGNKASSPLSIVPQNLKLDSSELNLEGGSQK